MRIGTVLAQNKYKPDKGIIIMSTARAAELLSPKNPTIQLTSTPEVKAEPEPTEPNPKEALINHIKVFADPKTGRVSWYSIHDNLLEKFHWNARKDGDAEARKISTGVMFDALRHGLKGVYPFGYGSFDIKEAAGKVTHPHDSGFFKRSGEHDEPKFTAFVKQYAINIDGVEYIKQQDFKDFIQKDKDEQINPDHRWHNASAMDNFVGEKGNEGEVRLVYREFSKINRPNPQGGTDDYLSVDDLRKVYLDFGKLVKERFEKKPEEVQAPSLKP